ncbi:MAG: class I SAM-dependent methyltransferase [Actinomycetota bacterium]|nr:class I SAM-dependent methyltransferase [Actinomycetota bacterium]
MRTEHPLRRHVTARAKPEVRRVVNRAVRRFGYQLYEPEHFEVILRSYYSPLPDFEHFAVDPWAGPAELPGVDLRVEAAIALLTGDLRPYLDSFRPPLRAEDAAPGAFYIANGSYESVDAEILYAMVRYSRPQRVVELGSGASSHVIAAAAADAAADGTRFDHDIFDPYPFEAAVFGPVVGATTLPHRAEDVDLEIFEHLKAGDIVFVDTTHTVKTGGDVNRIFLEILPRLAPGVLVHVHDIFLPYEYPRHWIVDEMRLWAEQYLLQAFLAFNSAFEVVFPAQAVTRAAPDLVKELIPSLTPTTSPGAFWMRRL